MGRMFCPSCMARRDRRLERRIETYLVRGEPIEVEADVAVCAVCGADVAIPPLEDETLTRAYDEYRRRHGIMRPEDVRQLRERYGLSQRGFARLLDWGPITIHRYETGALPDAAHNDLLVALQDEATMHDFVLRHKDRLILQEQRVVLDALEARRHAVGEEILHGVLQMKMDAFCDADRGFRQFDLDRMRQMVVYFTSGDGEVRTSLLKKLWYADFLMFKRFTVSLSGTAYLSYQYGPVPNAFDLLLGILIDEGVIEPMQNEYLTAEGLKTGTVYRACVTFEPSVFGKDELGVLKTVSQQFAGMRATELVRQAHEEEAWLQTGHREVIPYERAMSLSLQ